jgi:hypothetical protein
MERSMLQHMEQLKEMMRELQTMQSQLLAKMDHLLRFTGAVSGTADLPEEVHLPIATTQQFDVFDQQMKDQQLKQIVVRYCIHPLYFNMSVLNLICFRAINERIYGCFMLKLNSDL